MDYLNDFVPGIFGALNAKSLEDFKKKAEASEFIKPRTAVNFNPEELVITDKEVVIAFEKEGYKELGYREFINLDFSENVTAVEAFYYILSNQYKLNPRYCFFEAIERVKKPVVIDSELRYDVPLFYAHFRR